MGHSAAVINALLEQNGQPAPGELRHSCEEAVRELLGFASSLSSEVQVDGDHDGSPRH